MRVMRIDDGSPYRRLIGVGGIGTGIFFDLEGDHTLGRSESRLGRLLDVRDYCKLHIVIHFLAKLLDAQRSGVPFHVLPLARVGDDAEGHRMVKEISEAGIDTTRVRATVGKPTLFSVCFQYPDGTGGNITTNNSAAGALNERDIDDAAALLKSDASRTIAVALPEVPLEVRHHFLKLATEGGAFRAASFALAEIAPAKRAGMFNMLDLVSLNEEEATELVGCSFVQERPETFIQTCRQFLKTCYPNLRMVVSVGQGGAFALTTDITNYYPAPKINVVSTAGAGDALLGGILAAIAVGLPFGRDEGDTPAASIGTALELGVWLASFKCLSPHTIHPSANIDSVSMFVREMGHSFSPGIEALLVDSASP